MFGDQILNTEMINETLSNRQAAKLQYLQQENSQLQQEIEDLKDALRLNKEALRIAYSSNVSMSVSSTMASGIAVPSGFKQTSASTSYQQEDVSMKILQENEKLLGMISIISKQRNKAQSMALIKEQISEENSNFLQEQIAEKDEKIKDLRMLLQDKEFVIQEFEKAKGYYDYGSNVLVRIRDVTTPNEQSMKLHTDIENLKEIISKITEENSKQRATILQRDESLRVLRQEILKLRLVIMNPVNYQKMRGFLVNKFVENGDEDQNLCGAFYKEVSLQLQEQKLQEDLQEQGRLLLQQQKEQFDKQHAPLRPTRNPTLPPTPSQLSQSQRYATGNNPFLNPPHPVIEKLNDRIAKLEDDLSKMGKLYRKEIENNNLLVTRIDESMKETEQCFQNNELLINSNIGLQTQIEALQNEIIHFKRFQNKYFQLLRNRNDPCTLNRSAIHLDNYLSNALGNTQGNPSAAGNAGAAGSAGADGGQGALPNPTEREVNVSILEDDDEPRRPQNNANGHLDVAREVRVRDPRKQWETIRHDLASKRAQMQDRKEWKNDNILADIYQCQEQEEDFDFTKDQAKIYLMNLAKDLYVNTNIKTSGLTRQVLKQIEIGGYKEGIMNHFRSKRSLSNPIDYVFESKETISQVRHVGQGFDSNCGMASPNQGANLNGQPNFLKCGQIKINNRGVNMQQAIYGGQAFEEGQGVGGDMGDQQEIRVNMNNGLFNVDMSMIEDAQKKLRGKGVSRKQQIQIDASFISQGSGMEDLE